MNALPKGHIVGWVPPSSSQSRTQVSSSGGGSGGGGGGGGGGAKVPTTDANGQPLSKAALKNAKRKAKKIAEKANTAATGGDGSTSVSRAEDSDEEGGRPVVVAVDDAPDTWDDEGEEEAPAHGTPSPRGDTPAKESQICANRGVDAVVNGLEKLAVSE
jgi:partner of Y14 and mago protein